MLKVEIELGRNEICGESQACNHWLICGRGVRKTLDKESCSPKVEGRKNPGQPPCTKI